MKKLLLIFAFILSTITAIADKLPDPVKLEVAKRHIFSFDKESLTDNPYFPDVFSAGDKFTFDGENLLMTTKDGLSVNNPVRNFVKTENTEDNTWQYLITLDGKGDFPTLVEIKFLPSKEATVLFPMVDAESGDIYALLVSECKVF